MPPRGFLSRAVEEDLRPIDERNELHNIILDTKNDMLTALIIKPMLERREVDPNATYSAFMKDRGEYVEGRTALHDAAELNLPHITNLLLDYVKDPDPKCNITVLSPSAVREIDADLEKGEKLGKALGKLAAEDKRVFYGVTPLMVCSANDSIEAAEKLVGKGADLNYAGGELHMFVSGRNIITKGVSPIYTAVQSKNYNFIEKFGWLEGVKINDLSVSNHFDPPFYHAQSVSQPDGGAFKVDEFSPMSILHVALRKPGNMNVVVALCNPHDNQARVDATFATRLKGKDVASGIIPFHVAAMHGHIDYMKFLLENSPNGLSEKADSNGVSAIGYAADGGNNDSPDNVRAVNWLVSVVGFEPTAKDRQLIGNAVIRAANMGKDGNATSVAAIKAWFRYDLVPYDSKQELLPGRVISDATREYMTAIQTEVENDKDALHDVVLGIAPGKEAEEVSIVESMIKDYDEVDPNAFYNRRRDDGGLEIGRTALHDAARKGLLNIVKVLHKNGADPQATYRTRIPGVAVIFGTNALHEAAAGGHGDVIDYLVNVAKLDPNAQEINFYNNGTKDKGCTPLHKADAKAVAPLVRFGANPNYRINLLLNCNLGEVIFKNMTPLHLAIFSNDKSTKYLNCHRPDKVQVNNVVAQLLENGADHLAVSRQQKLGRLDPDGITHNASGVKSRITSVHYAAYLGLDEVIDMLYNKDPPLIGKTDSANLTAVAWCALNNQRRTNLRLLKMYDSVEGCFVTKEDLYIVQDGFIDPESKESEPEQEAEPEVPARAASRHRSSRLRESPDSKRRRTDAGNNLSRFR